AEREAANANAQDRSQELADAKIALARAEAVAARVPVIEAELRDERARVEKLTADIGRLEADRSRQSQTFNEKVEVLTKLRGEIEKEMKNLATEALQSSRDIFLTLATEVFEKHKQASSSSIEALLAPMNANLQEYRKGISDLEKARTEAYGRLSN